MIYKFQNYCALLGAPEEHVQWMLDFIKNGKSRSLLFDMNNPSGHMTRDHIFLTDMMCLLADLPPVALKPEHIEEHLQNAMQETTIVPDDNHYPRLLSIIDDWVDYLRDKYKSILNPMPDDQDAHPGIAMTIIRVNCRDVRKGRRPHSRRHKI